jgi:hypothetical protein
MKGKAGRWGTSGAVIIILNLIIRGWPALSITPTQTPNHFIPGEMGKRHMVYTEQEGWQGPGPVWTFYCKLSCPCKESNTGQFSL